MSRELMAPYYALCFAVILLIAALWRYQATEGQGVIDWPRCEVCSNKPGWPKNIPVTPQETARNTVPGFDFSRLSR